jgi:mannitol/fructose-specific phosphotransferase system IIA component (Ntr-type)
MGLDGRCAGAVVILLAVPTAEARGAHMKIFATLARRLMHEEFRARLLGARRRQMPSSNASGTELVPPLD